MLCNAGFPRTGLGACPLNVKLGFDSFQKKMRRPGIEPGSTAWKAAMLTIIPPTPMDRLWSKCPIAFGMLPEMATRVLCLLVLTLD